MFIFDYQMHIYIVDIELGYPVCLLTVVFLDYLFMHAFFSSRDLIVA